VNRLFRSVISLVLCVLASPAYAGGDRIFFTQSASGTITATLAGSVDPCTGSNHFPMGAATVGLNGNAYAINSFFVILDPPPCPAAPQAYEVTASLGIPADGHYTVTWTVDPLIVTGTFDVSAGVLQVATQAVPTMTLPALASLIAMVTLMGHALFRRRRRW
jgi:hypothetical protein